MRARLVVVAASALAMSVAGLNAQSVISAHSGVLHYYEGDVTIDGSVPHQKVGTFADVKEKQTLETQVGRAEVLLTPGVFLRLGENTGVRMVSNKLTDTQVEFMKGSAFVDFVEVAKDNMVTMNYQDYKVTFSKRGIYRFDSEPAELKVYTGEAVVTRGTSTVTLRDGRSVPFTPALISGKFDNRTGDSLYRWAKRRSEYIAVANLSAARQAGSSFTGTGTSGWFYNPYYSMFTFIPGRGYMCDPFSTFMSPYTFLFSSPLANGFGCYYSPMSAWNYFNRPTYYSNYGGGGRSTGLGSSAYNSSGYYPTSIGTSSTLSTYSGNSSSYSSAPSVSPSAGSVGSPSSGFSSGASSMGAGGGGGGASHGGGSAGGHGR